MFPLAIFFPSGRLLVSQHERLFGLSTCLTYKSITRHSSSAFKVNSSSTLIDNHQGQQEQQEQQGQQVQQ